MSCLAALRPPERPVQAGLSNKCTKNKKPRKFPLLCYLVEKAPEKSCESRGACAKSAQSEQGAHQNIAVQNSLLLAGAEMAQRIFAFPRA
jgi:hypothetical protein